MWWAHLEQSQWLGGVDRSKCRISCRGRWWTPNWCHVEGREDMGGECGSGGWVESTGIDNMQGWCRGRGGSGSVVATAEAVAGAGAEAEAEAVAAGGRGSERCS